MRELVVRADAGRRVGGGHFMRCLSLAHAWRRRGGAATFLGHFEGAGWRERAEEAGAGFEELGAPHPHPSDLPATLDRLARAPGGAWLALDGYDFPPEYQQAVKDAGHSLLVVDDTAHLPAYHAHVLLNQNPGAEALRYAADPGTRLLLGLRFALLRPEFASRPPGPREHPPRATRLLVTMGGSDPGDATSRVLRALAAGAVEGEVRVVVGGGNPHARAVERLAAGVSGAARSVRVLHDVREMRPLLEWAQVAVSAAGSTCWELAYLGVPAALLTLADNQAAVAGEMGRLGAALPLGRPGALGDGELGEALRALAGSAGERRRLSEAAARLVDGRGAERVVDAMLAVDANGEPLLRPARESDAEPLWRLANDPGVRANAFHPEPIPLERHLAWLARRLSSPDTRIWVLDDGAGIAGQVRYDRTGGAAAEIDFAVAPRARGRGLGVRLLAETWRAACEALGVEEAVGLVLDGNGASAGAFLRAGFRERERRLVHGRDCRVFAARLAAPPARPGAGPA